MNFHGFTPQEYSVIEKLLKCAKDVFVTICADDLDIQKSDEDSDVFYSNKVTADRLIRIASLNGVKVMKPLFLDKRYRFKTKELLHLEENIYSNVYKRYDDKLQNIDLFLAANPYSEIEHVANKIVENVRDKRL